MAPRVRIAPSPTGYFHVGTARAALYNWLFARQTGGEFLLRIEDTDKERNQPEQIQGIIDALEWLGLTPDGDVVFQSDRAGLHHAALERLLAEGKAYACDCTPEEVDARKKAAGVKTPGYDGYCRERSITPSVAGEGHRGTVIRFKTPLEGETSFEDVIRGRVTNPNAVIGDFSIRKSNGDPLFLISNTVDDADMGITHVIRGEDHVSNTAKYVLLWEALGYGQRPVFAHLPLLLNEQRKKLSKRRDKVSMESYQLEGYLPDAFCNYLALLGWSPGDDREILSRKELIAEFRLEDVKSAGAIFDERKLSSVNAEYLRAMTPEELWGQATEWLATRVQPILPLVQQRARTLSQVWEMSDFLFLSEPALDRSAWDKSTAKQPAFRAILTGNLERMEAVSWQAEAIRQAAVEAGEAVGVTSLGKAQEPLRLAITGRTVGPPLFESIELLGRDRTIKRLTAAVERYDAAMPADSAEG